MIMHTPLFGVFRLTQWPLFSFITLASFSSQENLDWIQVLSRFGRLHLLVYASITIDFHLVYVLFSHRGVHPVASFPNSVVYVLLSINKTAQSFGLLFWSCPVYDDVSAFAILIFIV